MQHAIIRYAGTYRFDRRETLEAALSRARAKIDEEHDVTTLAGGWLRCFVMQGTTLTVNLTLPAVAELQTTATEVFATLARAAIDGAVEATLGS
ncbi:MAG: hypothetical protein KF773_07085 [Deltaproteobacteria bacterium]|nr:hypothetical protein [Deltaproteobacteria bacterium]MCW5802201.1 hypothetical protein [Deltaproteobacteria bacterium]